jgi:CDP-diacylglycerol--glycerol-3-phosphate 3-phosphatidyltransferase
MANYLSFFRILIALPVVGSILTGQLTLALILFILGALSDLIDGKLARNRGQEGNFGKLLDPFADKVLVLSALVALIEVQMVKALPVILILARELSISFLRSVAVEHGVVMSATFLGKTKTFLEFISVVLLLTGSGLGAFAIWTAVALAYISLYDYIRVYLRSGSGLNYH